MTNKNRWYVMREQLPWWMIEASCWIMLLSGITRVLEAILFVLTSLR